MFLNGLTFSFRTCLHESEKHLLNLSRNLADFGLSSSVGSRLFPLHVVIQQFRDIVFSTDTVILNI